MAFKFGIHVVLGVFLDKVGTKTPSLVAHLMDKVGTKKHTPPPPGHTSADQSWN